MLYSKLITKMRNLVGDTRRRVHVDWTGDASTTVFQMPADTSPVLDQAGTYVVKLAGVTKTETTDFTFDKETGTLVMNVAPGSGVALTIDSSAVYVTDSNWIDIINSVLDSLGDDFDKEVTDETWTTTANMLSIAGITGLMAVYDFWYRQNTGNEWQPVASITNWRYSQDENKIYIGSRTAFTVTGELLKLRGLKRYTQYAAVTATLDIQDKFSTLLRKGCVAWYWRYRYKSVVETVSKMTQENTRTPLQELIKLADRCDREFNDERARMKPMKPARTIPIFKDGKPRP